MKTIYASLSALVLLAGSMMAEQPLAQPLPGNSSSSSPGSAVTPVAKPVPDGLVIAGGRLFLIRDGQATVQDRTYTMSISASGLTGFDGKEMAIPNGWMITMNGRLVALPDNLKGLPLEYQSGTGAAVTPKARPVTKTVER